ncbi:MAG: NlpC/P60 family protein, partial [Legionellales bacterium]|nr:NlpC/P60 family protein [Legionellales bacterium]
MFDDSSLEIGDLIFFMDSAKNAEHVAIYIGQRKHVPFIVHVVISTYKSIMMTRLKPSDEHCSYEVYRPKQSRLAWLAVAILFRWVELQVPYASESKSRLLERRISALTNGDHPTLGRQVQMAFARETFQSHFHQYVEAAYHMYSPRSMHAEGSLGLVGMSCSEAIVYAFNIAELLHNDALICTRSKDIDNGTFIWNTEAYPTESSYLDWARPVLPLDATRIRADSLYHHCNTHLAWRNMGTLTIHPVEALPEETYSKADWIAYT